MKQISWLLGILLFLSPLQMSAQKQDTVAVRETRIPVLIERQDNELFNLRIDATQSQVLLPLIIFQVILRVKHWLLTLLTLF